jgi:hypothetical protein
MTGTVTVSFIVGVYNEAAVLRDTVQAVTARLESLPGSELILVENGSTDGSFELSCRLAEEFSTPAVRVRTSCSRKGLGNALREGIRVAECDVVVLTAADLPFGFSDLDTALSIVPRPAIVLGSKGHARSVVRTSLQRRVMSAGFRLLRSALLDLRVSDSQGSITMSRELAQELLPLLESEGYFISTEIVAFAARAGEKPVEVPVEYANPRPDSKVDPLRDSWAMVRATVELRGRLRELPPGFVAPVIHLRQEVRSA